MIIALAFSYSSQDQTARLFERVMALGKYPNHLLVLGVEKRVTNRSFITDLIGRIETIEFEFTDSAEHYPESKNLAFQQCALMVQSLKIPLGRDDRWLYLEPDVVPIRGTFLDEIEAEMHNSHKPFVGPLVPAAPTHATPEHMAAVAVYPVDLIKAGAGDAMLANELPWSAVIARTVLANMAISKLICHDWEGKGVPDGCALYHPDRDGKILANLPAGPVPAESSRGDDEAREGIKPDGQGSPALDPHSRDGGQTILSGGDLTAPHKESLEATQVAMCESSASPAQEIIPWADRAESEKEIKRLCRALRAFQTAPVYTNRVRLELKCHHVVPGFSKVKAMKRRRRRLG